MAGADSETPASADALALALDTVYWNRELPATVVLRSVRAIRDTRAAVRVLMARYELRGDVACLAALPVAAAKDPSIACPELIPLCVSGSDFALYERLLMRAAAQHSELDS